MDQSKAIKKMTDTDFCTPQKKANSFAPLVGSNLGTRGASFSLDFAVIEDQVEAESYSKGEFYSGGAAGTWFWIDPIEDLVFAEMIQQSANLIRDVRALVGG